MILRVAGTERRRGPRKASEKRKYESPLPVRLSNRSPPTSPQTSASGWASFFPTFRGPRVLTFRRHRSPPRPTRDAPGSSVAARPDAVRPSPSFRNRGMNRDPILIRVDGTTPTGWEHFSRCLTLAAALQRRRRPTYFLSRLEPGYLGLNVKRGGNEWLEADSPVGTPEDLDETIQEIRRLNPAAVIVDAPEANEAYLNALRATGVVLVSIDSQARVHFPSRLVINPLLGPGREAYECERGSQLLLGPRYALVRSEIRRVRPLRAQEPPLCSAEERESKSEDRKDE